MSQNKAHQTSSKNWVRVLWDSDAQDIRCQSTNDDDMKYVLSSLGTFLICWLHEMELRGYDPSTLKITIGKDVPTVSRPLRITANKAAELLGISTVTLYKYAADGTIPAKRVGRNWFFVREILETWLASQSDPSIPEPEIDW